MESSQTYNQQYQRWEWRNSQDQLHREDGPAIEYDNGTKYWYRNGRLHREDGPAVEYVNGCGEWWVNGLCIGSPEERREKEILRKENESTLI